MSDPIPGAPDGIRGMLLLDMGVERVEVNTTGGVPNLIHEADRLIQRVQVIELKPVDDFLCQYNAGLLGVLSYSPQMVDAALPLF